MGKTYLETIKYLIIADFQVDGLVEKPDVIGAIFGQSEGLLGSQLDIKELQQNGKIGRIEITTAHNNNKTFGTLKLPCSLSMVETVIIAASIESIDKVGPCDTRFSIKKIEDTRGLKRKQIKDRAIDLLGKIMQEEIPDTKELMEEIVNTFKIKEIVFYGPDKLPAGPTVESNKELIIVEGRADVITMLKYGFTNVISTGGARIPVSLPQICKNKIVTLFLDGDRGADIQQAQLLRSVRVDFVARAPDGKEVEELTQKEINQALRRKIKANFVVDVIKDKSNYDKKINNSSSSQPNIVKQTKYSTTNDHKVINRTNFKSYPKSENNFSANKPTNDFSNMLSNIPDVERIDVSDNKFSKPSFNNRSNHSNNRSNGNNRSNYRDHHRSNDKSYQNRTNDSRNNDLKNNQFNKQNDLPKSHDIHNSPEFKTHEFKNNIDRSSEINKAKEASKVQEANKIQTNQTKITLKDRLESALKEFDSKSNYTKSFIDSNLKKSIEPVLSKTALKEKIKVEDKKSVVVEKSKKKPVVLPKLTDKIKKSILKILEEVDGKGQSRILNEKLRRIGSSKSDELISKIKSFKAGKIYAIVTDMEVTSEILSSAKEKNIMFLIAPRSKFKDDPKINIITYNELKK